MKAEERYSEVIDRFIEHMPSPRTELHYDNPYQLLVAVVLSAQCTDKRVNLTTPAFFEAFPTPEALAAARPEDVFELIKSISYPNNKTKSLIGMARRLVDDFGGQVPDDIDSLLTLPGVGRKTANVILSVVYDRPAMAVDTHVFRVAERLGLTTRSRNPLTTEKTLTRNIPEELIATAHHWLILHGRYVCKARKPECGECFLRDVCRAYPKFRKENEKEQSLKDALAAKKKS
ncbi:MAG: endonuclease III [Muribaculaceae bacterium]|nr:endonuclease III [Muribaculaceae bacterium]